MTARLMILWIIVTAQVTCLAQPSWKHIKFSELASTRIMFSIHCDADNNIYLGRAGSLEIWDGTKWTLYDKEHTKIDALNGFDIRDIKFSGNGFWASTNDGLLHFDGSKFKNYYPPNTPTMYSPYIRGISIDRNGDIWFTSHAAAISKFDATTDTVINYQIDYHTVPIPLYDSEVQIDSDDNMWYYEGKKIVKFKDSTATVFDTTSVPFLGLGSISSAQQLKDSSLLFISKKCLITYKKGVWDTLSIPAGVLSDTLEFSKCRLDDKDNLWILIHRNGSMHYPMIYKVEGTNWTKIVIPMLDGDTFLPIVDFCFDRKGKLWLAASDRGIYIFDPYYNSITDYNASNHCEIKISPNPVKDILSINSDNYKSNSKIQIFSILGIKILETAFTTTFDLSSLPPGIYFIRLGNEYKKFVKE